jgi:hypothetical protein
MKGEGDREMLLAILQAKTAEDQVRLALPLTCLAIALSNSMLSCSVLQQQPSSIKRYCNLAVHHPMILPQLSASELNARSYIPKSTMLPRQPYDRPPLRHHCLIITCVQRRGAHQRNGRNGVTAMDGQRQLSVLHRVLRALAMT